MVASIVAVLLAISPGITKQSPPPVDTSGGPDEYGYRWLNSDTTAPGAPTYTWVDIKGVGTEIENLADDDIKGPFDIGFEFPYYWYKVTSFFLGSNGYIAFHDNTLAAPDFPLIPGTSRPNNTLAVFMADMDPSESPNGSVWYWTNAANDTCIIQYDSIRFWSVSASNNTYQIIISKPDSAITFQYKEQNGTPSNGWIPASNQCGIENVSGRVGLNYLSGNLPRRNFYHPELALRFFPPESTSMEVDDAGVRNAMNDRSGGFFTENGDAVTFWAVVQNYGNQPAGDFKCYVNVWKRGYLEFSDSATVSVPNPGDIDSIVFATTWTPTFDTVYSVKFNTALPGDDVPTNDTAVVECRVVTLPTYLTYVASRDTFDQYYQWNGPGGYGARFVPPEYPIAINQYRMNATSSSGAAPCAFCIFDDNGPSGGPGDTLYIQTVTVTPTVGWYSVTPSSPVVITEGAFFIGAMSSVPSAPSFAMDSIPPVSGQTWEYTGGWAISREASIRDGAFEARVAAAGVEEWLEPAPLPARLDVSPNPFGSNARLRLVNPRGGEQAVGVYDAAGNLVRSLDLTRGNAVFNGKDENGQLLAEGIYFARVIDTDSQVSKLVIAR